MLESYTDKLLKCTHYDEVWALMSDKVYPNSNNSLFGDKQISIRRNRLKFSDITPPSEQIGLAYRIVLYLVLDGEIGDKPKNSGCLSKALKFERVIREMSDICKISMPNDITTELIDVYIGEQRKKGIREKSLHQKIYILFQWYQHAYLLPPFLRLTYDLFDSKGWISLVKATNKQQQDYLKDIGGSKEPYPLDKLAIIVTEAFEYIETYADDCIVAAQIYKEAQKENLPDTSSGHLLSKIFRITKHQFVEPELKKTQHYTLSFGNHSWVANPKIVTPPRQVCLDSTHRLQAACVIIILMITAMRKGELEMMVRYPKTKKTLYHELDGSFELERLIYKTAEADKGESHSIAVPPIIIRAFYLLSYISEISDGKKSGTINLMSLNYSSEINNEYRINYLINSFCSSIDIIPPTPHQFRHAMAFLVAFMNDDIGIELAMTLLAHKSIEMTKRYMGHYKQIILKTFNVMFDENKQIQEAMAEFQAEESSSGLEKIIHAVEEEEPMAGPIAKRLLQGFKFSGSITDEGKIFFAKSQRLLMERGMLAVVEHPTHFCVRDLSDSVQMPCQIGLNIEDFTNAPVISAQCQTKCGSKLYTESKVEYMKELAREIEDAYPEDLVSLLKGNRYYMENSSEQHYANVINEFEIIKQEKENNIKVKNG